MKTVEIKCDRCGRDLATTGNSIDWRISLKSEPIPSWGGAVTDMMIYPQIKSELHFCSLPHLLAWAEEKSRRIESRQQAGHYVRRRYVDGSVGSRFEREALDA